MKKKLLSLTAALLTACTLTACSSGSQPSQNNLFAANPASSIQPNSIPDGQASVPQQTASAEPTNPGQPFPPAQSSAPIQQPSATVQPSINPQPITPAVPANVSIRSGGWNDVEWEQYSSQYFTVMIPKGWQVKVSGGAGSLAWTISSPDGFTGYSSQDHPVYAAKDYQIMQQIGAGMYLQNGTVQEYFKTYFSDSTENFTVVSSCLPSNYQQIQAILGADGVLDYASLYATFRENGREGEGVYSAMIGKSQDVYYNGYNYGMWTINLLYGEWAPLGELKNWQPIIAQSSKTFQFTQEYYQEAAYVLGGSTPSSINDNDVVMEAFEERSLSDTIIQEKRSDMIGEYERVYDNESGKIYRAYNGFLDDLGAGQSRFTPITDPQYAEGYSGWIEK